MGYGVSSLKLMVELKRRGLLDNCDSVMELGSQDIINLSDDRFLRKFLNAFGVKDIDTAIEEFFRIQREEKNTGAGWTYRYMGFKEYACIDADGRHNALVFDLTCDLRRDYNFNRQYDLVTNHGTTEHVFDVAAGFRNIHNLCRKGGLMIHGLPFQGYTYHCFYNFMPNFYRDLCAANDYELVGCFINFSPAPNRIYEMPPKYIGLLTFTDALLFYVFKKHNDDDFKAPYQDNYKVTSRLNKERDSHKSTVGSVAKAYEQKGDWKVVRLVFISIALSIWANTLKFINFLVTIAKALIKCAI